MPVRFGLIGCGGIGPVHAEAIKRTEGAELVAAASRTAEGARAFSEARGIGWCASAEELLRRPDIDAVSICTPSGLHAEMTIAAARAGKHVVVEKPIAITLAQTDTAIAACRDAGRALAVISQLRFAPEVRAVREAVAGGSLGRLVLVDLAMKYFRSQAYYDSGAWRGTLALDGGGAVINQGIHGVDLAQWIAGMPRWVFGRASTLVRRMEGEDTAVAVGELPEGALLVITATTSVSPGQPRRLAFHGERGTIVLEETRVVQWDVEGAPRPSTAPQEARSAAQSPTALGVEEHAAQYRDFVESVVHYRPPAVTGEDGRRSLALVLAIYESSRSGQPVVL